MLAIAGETDLRLSAGPHLSAIEGALESGGNPHVTVRAMPGLNHFLQEADSGSPAESARIAQTVSPSVLELLSGWGADGTLLIVVDDLCQPVPKGGEGTRGRPRGPGDSDPVYQY